MWNGDVIEMSVFIFCQECVGFLLVFWGGHSFLLSWSNVLTVLSLRDGSVNSCDGKKIHHLRTEPCGRICQWSGGSSVFHSLNEMPFTNKKAMQFITMATGLPTLSMFQLNRFRLVYLDLFHYRPEGKTWHFSPAEDIMCSFTALWNRNVLLWIRTFHTWNLTLFTIVGYSTFLRSTKAQFTPVA